MLVEANSKAFPMSEEALRKWAKREGIFLHPEAAFLVKTQTMGMGVFAKRGIGKGQTVISCPHTAYIAPMDEKVDNAPSAAAIAGYRFHKATVLAAAAAATSSSETTEVAPSSVNEGAGTVTSAASATTPLAEDRLDDWTRTVLRLMAEVLRADSPWRTWLQCCPRMPDSMFTVPLPAVSGARNATEDQKQQQQVLFGLPSHLRVGDDNATTHLAIVTGPAQQLCDLNIEEKWTLAKPLLDANPNIWPATLPAHCNPLPLSAAAQQAAARAAATATASRPSSAAPVASPPPRLTSLKDLFYECAAQVTSRNFHRESQDRPGPYLLPTIDFLNHSSDRQNVEFAIHGGGGGKRHVTFDVIATRDILPKEQIFHDYGSLNASRFLVEFQFVLHQKALANDEGLRWSKEALSTLVSLLYAAGNKARQSSKRTETPSERMGSPILSFKEKYNTCLARCKYLIKHDLFLFEEGVLLSGGKNESVGGGDNSGTMGSGGSGQTTDENSLKSAAIIDYASGTAIASTAAHQQNGAVGTGGGAEGRSAAARRAERKALEIQYLNNVLFLLSVTDACFEGLKPFMSRHWSVLDIPRNRKDYEATGAGQRVVASLLSGTAAAAASSSTAASAQSSSVVSTHPVILAETLIVAPDGNKDDGSTTSWGAFAAPTFCVSNNVLRESVATSKFAEVVRDSLTRPFVAAYGNVLQHQIEVLKKGSGVSEAQATMVTFATPRVSEMLHQVLAHEYSLTQALLKDL